MFLYSSVKLPIADVDIHDSSEEGIHCSGGRCGVRASGLTLSKNGFGSTFPGGPEYSYNISAHVVRGTNITVTDNAGFGVYADRFNITGLIATGNGNAGLYAGRGKLVDRKQRLRFRHRYLDRAAPAADQLDVRAQREWLPRHDRRTLVGNLHRRLSAHPLARDSAVRVSFDAVPPRAAQPRPAIDAQRSRAYNA